MVLLDFASKDVADRFTEVLKDPQTGSWKEKALSQTYSLGDLTLNQFRMNSLVFYYFDEKVADLPGVGDAKNEIIVSNTYIFCFIVKSKHLSSLDKVAYVSLSRSVPLGGHIPRSDARTQYIAEDGDAHSGSSGGSFCCMLCSGLYSPL